MQIDTNALRNAASRALLTIKAAANRPMTGREFKAACDATRSLLGLAEESTEIAQTVRAEHLALRNASESATFAGAAFHSHTTGRVRLTATGGEWAASKRFTREAVESEVIDTCKRILAQPAPADTASEGTKARYHARQRQATMRLCLLDADFALADAERRLEAAAEHHARAESAALARAAAAAAAAAGQPVTPAMVSNAKAKAKAEAAPVEPEQDATGPAFRVTNGLVSLKFDANA